MRWFGDAFEQQRALDVIVRWLLACAPAMSVTDAREHTVLFADRMQLSLEHPWRSLPFGEGWVLRVAEPTDVRADLFEARIDEAMAYIRALFNGGGRGFGAPPRGGDGGPSSAALRAHKLPRRRD